MPPAEISGALGLNSRIERRAGDQRTTPVGGALTGLNSETHWSARLSGDHEQTDMVATVTAWLDKLEDRKPFIDRLVDSGGTMELFIGWFSDGNSAERFLWPTLQRLSELRINLSIDVYGSGIPNNASRV